MVTTIGSETPSYCAYLKDKSVKSNSRGAGGTGFLTVEQGRDLKRNSLRVKKTQKLYKKEK